MPEKSVGELVARAGLRGSGTVPSPRTASCAPRTASCAVLPVAERLQMWHMPCSGVSATAGLQNRCLGTLAP